MSITKKQIFIQLKNFYLIFLLLFISCNQLNRPNDFDWNKNKQIKKSFFANGNLEYESELFNGKLNGTTTVWLENGTIFSTSQYSNSIPHGKWKRFHSSGALMFELTYVYGKKDGYEKWYHENGNIKSEQYFKNGESKSAIVRWDQNGNLIY